MVTDIGPYNVETAGADENAVRYPFQRKDFYARGYHWAFYIAGGKIYWRRSDDGITWSSPAVDITPAGAPADGAELAVWLDRHEEPAQYVHIAYADRNADSILYYRRASIAEDGTLSWVAWQTAVDLAVGVSYKNLTICVDDTNGYPFIGYTHTIRADPPSESKPRVTHSRQTDGTWSTHSPGVDFPKALSNTNDTSWVCVVVPYSGIYIKAVYVRNGNNILYNVYNITTNSWYGQEDTGMTMGPDATKMSVTTQREGRYAAIEPRQAHIVYCDSNENLQHVKIVGDSPAVGPTLIYDSATPMGPCISTRIFGGEVNPHRTLYVFWTPITAEPTANWACYKKSVDGGATWTNESGVDAPELWLNETGAGFETTNIASSYFEEQHNRIAAEDSSSKPTSFIGILYTNKGSSPDYVRWGGLEFADPDEDLLGKAIIRQTTSIELFDKFIVRHMGTPVELLGKIPWLALPKVELLGRFDIGQNAEDLLAHAEILNIGSVELLGGAVIQHVGTPVELLGRTIIRHDGVPVELFGKAIIRQTATPELLGGTVIQHVGTPVELLGKAIIRGSDSEELLGKAEVQHSSLITDGELYCKFRTSTPDWIMQGVSVEAYITKSIVI